MKFKVTKIAAAVAAGLGVSLVGMNGAYADQIFFPYVVLSQDVTTVLTVINDDDPDVKELHYRYYRKDATVTPIATSECKEFDFWDNTSENDVVTFDLGGQFGAEATGLMFEPTQAKAVNKADFRLDGGLRSPDKRGYVLVDNYSPVSDADPIPSPTSRLHGEAIVIEFTTGSAWGYNASNASEIWGFTPGATPAAVGSLTLLNRYDFSDRVETNGDVMVAPPITVTDRAEQKSDYWSPVAIMPFAQVTTKFLVTPIATAAPFQGPNSVSNTTATVQLNAASGATDRVLFDRDERPFSGSRAVQVRCVHAVTAAELIDENVFRAAPMGGWTHLALTAGQAVVMKAEYNPDPTAVGGEILVNGSWNNVLWLRKGIRESLPRTLIAGLGPWGVLPTYDIPGIDNNAPYFPLNTVAVAAASVGPNNCALPLLPPAVLPATLPGRPASAGNCVLTGAEYYAANLAANPAAVAAAINAGNVFVSTGQ